MTSNTRTYRHKDDKGNDICWMTEVTADKFSSYSRVATGEEVTLAIAAEDRALRIAAYAAGLDATPPEPPADPDVAAAEIELADKALAQKENDAKAIAAAAASEAAAQARAAEEAAKGKKAK